MHATKRTDFIFFCGENPISEKKTKGENRFIIFDWYDAGYSAGDDKRIQQLEERG